MADIVINGTSYPLKFGMRFLREVNARNSVPVEGLKGVQENVGLRLMIAELIEGSPEALADCIFIANKTEEPKLNAKMIDEYIEDEGTDIEELFDKVLNFLEKANATAKTYKALTEALEQAQAAQE